MSFLPSRSRSDFKAILIGTHFLQPYTDTCKSVGPLYRNRSRSGSLQTCLLSDARTDAASRQNKQTASRDYSRFGLGGSVSLPSVLEPVADLGGGETRLLRQLALLPRGRVGVLSVPLTQDDSRLLLEAVARLLAVPYGPREGELAPNAILAHGTQRLSAETFGLDVVCLQPQLLHLRVGLQREVVALQHAVELGEVSLVERDERPSLHDALVLLNLVASGQAPQEPRQPLYVPALLKNVAHAGHLLRRETVGAVRNHPGGELVTVHDGPSEGERLHCRGGQKLCRLPLTAPHRRTLLRFIADECLPRRFVEAELRAADATDSMAGMQGPLIRSRRLVCARAWCTRTPVHTSKRR